MGASHRIGASPSWLRKSWQVATFRLLRMSMFEEALLDEVLREEKIDWPRFAFEAWIDKPNCRRDPRYTLDQIKNRSIIV